EVPALRSRIRPTLAVIDVEHDTPPPNEAPGIFVERNVHDHEFALFDLPHFSKSNRLGKPRQILWLSERAAERAAAEAWRQVEDGNPDDYDEHELHARHAHQMRNAPEGARLVGPCRV